MSTWAAMASGAPRAPQNPPHLSPALPAARGGLARGGLAHMMAGTPAASRAPSQAPSRAPSDAGDSAADRMKELTLTPSPARRKKTKAKKKTGPKGAHLSTNGLERPDFLLPQALKGASQSALQDKLGKVAQEKKDDDWTFVKRPVASTASSITSSPPRSGLSSLLNQPHPADLEPVENPSTPPSSDYEEREDVVSYEVTIKQDYVAKGLETRPATPSGRPINGAVTPPPKKKMTADDFEVLKILGKGAYGTVMLVRHKATGKLYAQKQLKKASLVIHKKVIEQTRTERAILESVSHPNVVKLYYAFQDHEKLYLILEYAQGGELFHHLSEMRMLPEPTVAFYIAQLVLALSHLHQNVGVVYRDLKPENCLLDTTGNLLLTDFGLSKVRTDEDRCLSLLGTPEYMAPEVLSGDGNTEYGPEVDWWGVGILTHELLTGSTPFEGNSAEKVKQRIRNRKLTLPPYLSNDAKDLITKLLRKQPEKRLGYNTEKDLPAIKKHRFFRMIDWAKLERKELIPPIQPLVTDPELAENFATEFTEAPLSPPGEGIAMWGSPKGVNPFKGFTFVAESFLERHMGGEESEMEVEDASFDVGHVQRENGADDGELQQMY